MHLLAKLSEPFLKHSENKEDNYSMLFDIGEEISQLERKRRKLYERLGNEVYHQRLERVNDLKEEIKYIDIAIIKKTNEMEKL